MYKNDPLHGKPKPRINGSLLQNYIGRPVCLLGTVQSEPDPSGLSFQLHACDNVPVNIVLREPLQEYIKGIVEIQGVVKNKNTVTCISYVYFSPEISKNFDLQHYNEAITLANQFPKYYIQDK